MNSPASIGWVGRLLLQTILLVASIAVTAAQESQSGATVDAYVFWSRTCPHCERALAYLGRLEIEKPALRLHRFEVTGGGGAAELFRRVNEAFAIDSPAVPMIIIGDAIMIGYDYERSSETIAARVEACSARPCPDLVKALIPAPARPQKLQIERPSIPRTIDIPLFGEVETADLSLPMLTISLAAVDGFNPCAMWGLVFLLGVLIGIKDRRRMWVLGSTFIIVSALVYFAIMAAWLNLLLLLGALVWIRVGVAMVALAGGTYYLREFARGEVSCKISAPEGRRRLLSRIRDFVQQRQMTVALPAVVVLAVAVNLIDLLCSAGLPVVYTEALSQSQLPPWQYYTYLALYILVFMADDLLIFATAVTTLTMSAVAVRYTQGARLVGGVLLLGIGGLLLFRPEWLAFR